MTSQHVERELERNDTDIYQAAGTEEEVHPLEHTWTLWFDRRVYGKDVSWEANLKKIGEFNTVEEFWSYYNFVKKPSDIPMGSNYHLFKADIKPMWEDPANKEGGKWILALKPKHAHLLNEYWEQVVLGMVGETLDVGNQICGAVVSRRKAGDKIALWNRTAEKDIYEALGYKLRELLQLPEEIKIEYQHHSDSLEAGSSYTVKSRLEL